MPLYEAFVTKTVRNGLVEVVIQPGSAGILGAPNVNVCHAPTSSSRITAQAVNDVGAREGDLVSVSRKPGALLKNAAILLGIPLFGLLAGLVPAGTIDSWAVWTTASSAAAGLVLGVVFAVILYRSFACENPLIISGILKEGAGDGFTSLCNLQGCGERSEDFTGKGCGSCLGR